MEVLALPDFQGLQRLKITLQNYSLNLRVKDFSQHFTFTESYSATGSHYIATLDQRIENRRFLLIHFKCMIPLRAKCAFRHVVLDDSANRTSAVGPVTLV